MESHRSWFNPSNVPILGPFVSIQNLNEPKPICLLQGGLQGPVVMVRPGEFPGLFHNLWETLELRTQDPKDFPNEWVSILDAKSLGGQAHADRGLRADAAMSREAIRDHLASDWRAAVRSIG